MNQKSNPVFGDEKMKVTIVYDEKQNFQRGNLLGCNLNDFAHSLNKNLRRHHSAKSEASFFPGRVELEVTGAGLSEVTPMVGAFHKAMVRHGFRLMVTYA